MVEEEEKEEVRMEMRRKMKRKERRVLVTEEVVVGVEEEDNSGDTAQDM